MSCLFCGKELGPLRLLRKEEFCSSAHRRLYKERLGKVLGAIGAPEPPPAPPSGFLTLSRPAEGPRTSIVYTDTSLALGFPLHLRYDWPVAIPSVAGDLEASIEPPAVTPPESEFVSFGVATLPSSVGPKPPSFALDVPNEMERLREIAALRSTSPAGARDGQAAPQTSTVQHVSDLFTADLQLDLPFFPVSADERLARPQHAGALLASDPGGLAPTLQSIPAARWVAASTSLDLLSAASIAMPPAAMPLRAVPEDLKRLGEISGLKGSDRCELAPTPQPALVAMWLTPASALQTVCGALPVVVPAAVLPFQAVGEDIQRLAECSALRASDRCELAPTPQPALVAMWLTPASALQTVCGALPVVVPAAVLPFQAVGEDIQRLAECSALTTRDLCGPAAPLQPAPVAMWLTPASALQTVCAPLPVEVPSAVLPFQAVGEDIQRLAESSALRASNLCGPAAPLQPVLVAQWVTPAAGLDVVVSAAPLALPRFELARDSGLRPAMCSEADRAPAPREIDSRRAGAPVVPFQRTEALPRFDVTACVEPMAAPVETVPRPPASEEWMAAPQPMVAARLVLPAALVSPLRAALHQSEPAVQGLPSPPALHLPRSVSLQESDPPEAAETLLNWSLATETVCTGDLQLPAIPRWQARDAMRHVHLGPVDAPEPEAVEAWPSAESRIPVPTESSPRLMLPALHLEAVVGDARPGCSSEPDMASRPALPAPAVAQVAAPMISNALRNPTMGAMAGFALQLEQPGFRYFTGGFATMDFHCRPTPGVISKRIQPVAQPRSITRPRLTLRPVFDRWEELAPPPSEPSFGLGNVLVMRRKVHQFAASKRTRHLVGTIAAGLFLGAALYFGTSSVRPHRNAALDAGDVAMSEIPAAAPALKPSGPVARLRQAISERAAASWSDTFRSGMESWGATSKSWAPGWSKSRDGYVQPGSLAIFRPSSTYTDYQLEFFGQIERKSMDWVVRAHDPKNYYAMKFTVIEAGLRPIIAMVHYSVVGGKKNRPHSLPLMNIMVHNGRPMQVLVDVKGNHFSASVDGQQVESWTDDAPSSGGVGFFADAGEKARLYWMRVSKNEDFLGRICAYFSGSSNTAELWPTDPYGRPHHGGPQGPYTPAESLGLAAVVTLRRRRMRTTGSGRAKYFAERRIESWRS